MYEMQHVKVTVKRVTIHVLETLCTVSVYWYG